MNLIYNLLIDKIEINFIIDKILFISCMVFILLLFFNLI